MQFDCDLTAFLITVGNIIFGSMPALRRNSIPIPIKYEIEEVPPSALTERQAAVFAPYDVKLAAMNYSPTCTYRVANYGHNLMRSYVNPAETSRCIVMIVEVMSKVANLQPVSSTCVMSFETWFSNNTIHTTRNMRLKSLLDRPPYQSVQECPYITEPAEMKKVHDAAVAKLGCPVAPSATAAQIFERLHEEHDWFSEYQLKQGIYRPNPDGTTYAMADKALWRGIYNHLNPFVTRFYAWRFLPAVLLSVLLPIFTVLNLVPRVTVAAIDAGWPVDFATRAVMLGSFAAAGVVIGLMLENATFVWVFILTYIPIRIVAPGTMGSIPYSTFAAVIAYAVGQARQRTRTILLPQRAR